MGEEITVEDGGKRVIDSNGNEIGVVMDVDDGTAYVDPSEELGGELKTRLGWGRDTESRYPLRNDAIGEITDEEIRLREEY
ncbi:PRC-barrel domain containing protein [Natrinema zhouii]|uniref:PRC-barrel domain containing protein n=1 Tax=Natrinema zhouii TaxID=1710539 RepID=A0A7D6GXV3_9EURY|nr:PRC-barrel domain containing protein [Natrinema zhouii]QLK24445.1 PRC-barrel domain containing protein [Natrinema zhouii]